MLITSVIALFLAHRPSAYCGLARAYAKIRHARSAVTTIGKTADR